jgi:hypothetical protein
MRWAGYVAGMVEMRNAHRSLMGEGTPGKRTLGYLGTDERILLK